MPDDKIPTSPATTPETMLGAAPEPASAPAATPGRLPAVYLGHGAPTLIADELWPVELAAWSAAMPRPRAILVVSAHWQSAPLTLGAVDPAPLVYDFYGFPERYYQIRYDSPAAASAVPQGLRRYWPRLRLYSAARPRNWRKVPRSTQRLFLNTFRL